ncbi:MAG: hypothetical protein NDJ24_02925 [Alphaproteobacteria bacterium]|nr:hypothetical protein [Alphaproteobacteria bacterium]
MIGSESKVTQFVVYDFDPHNLPPEYLRAIGLVVASSAQTEHVLQDFIGALLGIDNIQTVALTSQMSFPLKNDIIGALAELDAPNINELDKIDDLLEAASKAMDKRNIVAHNNFMRNPDTGQVYSHRLRAKGSIKLDLKPISVVEIQQIAEEIYKAGMDIMSFMISRKLESRVRTAPMRETINRGKRAREERCPKAKDE